MGKIVLQLFTLFTLLVMNQASEFCTGLKLCDDYCCGSRTGYQYCCSICTASINYNPNSNDCFVINIGAIIGGILSFIAFIVIVSLLVACCCGCICSTRTGIQRRGRVINPPASTVTVISQNQTAYPPGQYTYPQGQPVYPQGQPAYYQGQPPYPQGQPAYLQGQPAYPPTNQNYQNPPPYVPGYAPEKQ